MIKRFKDWNRWRKSCLNGKIHKFIVLIGLRKSDTFEIERSSELLFQAFQDGFWEGFNEEEKNG